MYTGEEFLNKIYKDLINTKEIKHTSIGRNKNEDLNIYLNRIERITRKSKDHDNLRIIKELYHQKYVIKKENIKESYFEKREQIASVLGYGKIKYTEELKEQEKLYIIKEQEKSLDEWIEYFSSKDTEMYPTWFKYFCFQGMIRIGYLDKKNKKFTKRTETTAKPFIEINKEAISMIYSELIKILNKKNISDKQLEELLKNGSFSKIYAYCILKIKKQKQQIFNSEEGIWKKYDKKSNPYILFSDIHNKGTGWCTAGGIETAKAQLEEGDFYVYFTKDEFEKYTNPRIAIRMKNEKIIEIRGIEENQNIEPCMGKIVEKKLEEFENKEEYIKKIKDMEILSEIYIKEQKNVTKEELMLIYKLKKTTLGFGYEEEELIEKIIKKRNNIQDLNYIFKEIETIENDLNLPFLKTIENLNLPKKIKGNLILSGIEEIEELTIDSIIYGDLNLRKLKKAKKIKITKPIKGTLDLKSLEEIEELEIPNVILKTLDLRKLKTIKTLKLPEINKNIYLDNIKNAKNIIFPKIVKGSLDLTSLESIKNIKLPKEINGYLALSKIKELEQKLPNINGTIFLENLKTTKKLNLPEIVNGDLYLNSIETINNIKLPKIIKGNLYLNNLKTIKNIEFPEQIEGQINLLNLEETENVIIPKELECKIKCPLVKNDINTLKQLCKQKAKCKKHTI